MHGDGVRLSCSRDDYVAAAEDAIGADVTSVEGKLTFDQSLACEARLKGVDTAGAIEDDVSASRCAEGKEGVGCGAGVDGQFLVVGNLKQGVVAEGGRPARGPDIAA